MLASEFMGAKSYTPQILQINMENAGNFEIFDMESLPKVRQASLKAGTCALPACMAAYVSHPSRRRFRCTTINNRFFFQGRNNCGWVSVYSMFFPTIPTCETCMLHKTTVEARFVPRILSLFPFTTDYETQKSMGSLASSPTTTPSTTKYTFNPQLHRAGPSCESEKARKI